MRPSNKIQICQAVTKVIPLRYLKTFVMTITGHQYSFYKSNSRNLISVNWAVRVGRNGLPLLVLVWRTISPKSAEERGSEPSATQRQPTSRGN